MKATAFSLDAVTCQFGDLVAVDDVTLRIGATERVALIGSSGAGKTTLLRVLNSIRAPSQGGVSILGNDVSTLGARALRQLRTKIAFIPQHLGLVPNLSVLQNVILGKGGARGLLRSLRDLLFPAKLDVLEIHEILERVGIEEKLYSRTDKLSGGQQQRVAIARALFQKPAALLADEPVSSVDPARARDTVRLLSELSKEHGFSLCVSLHNLDLAREFFPRLIGLRAGKVVFDGKPDSLDESLTKTLFDL
ncbi:MAG: phosphonate transport system ATP-binding protein [Verrucomicrobiales bacterium]|jgi:phosphonate transport system ATP-binding protein